MKKNGRRGKKKPKMIPWSMLEVFEELDEEREDWDKRAEEGVSRESIHCSSRAR
jgi:hypothetical protein